MGEERGLEEASTGSRVGRSDQVGCRRWGYGSGWLNHQNLPLPNRFHLSWGRFWPDLGIGCLRFVRQTRGSGGCLGESLAQVKPLTMHGALWPNTWRHPRNLSTMTVTEDRSQGRCDHPLLHHVSAHSNRRAQGMRCAAS